MTNSNKPRVLCVDDEPMVLEVLTLHLRTRFDLLTSTSGASGLERLKYDGPFAVVVQAVIAAVEQHRLIQAERVLLEQTLSGAIKMLTEVLSIANPVAFGRAVRLKRLAEQLCDRLEVSVRWHIEAAAQFSQIGCITLQI